MDELTERALDWDQAARTADYQARINPAGWHGTDAYDESGNEHCAQLLALGARYLQIVPPVHCVLDFGCGDGRVLQHWPDVWRRIGADASDTMLDHLADRDPTIERVRWDGSHILTSLRGQVHVAFAIAVLIHHTVADGLRIAANMADTLAPGGLLLLQHPIYDRRTHGGGWIDVSTWQHADLLELERRAGLQLLEAHSSPGQFTWGTELGAEHGAIQVLRRPEQ